MSKILRIDNQGCCERRIYDSKKDLRDSLIDFHLTDCEEEDEKGLKKCSLNEICSYGDWSYELISDEEAKKYEEVNNG